MAATSRDAAPPLTPATTLGNGSSTPSPSSSRFTPDFDEDDKTLVTSRVSGSGDDDGDDGGFEMKELRRDDGGRRDQGDDEKRGLRDGGLDAGMEYSPLEERQVLKKLDRKVVLFVALLYMLSFLDRSNIGNARIAGLERDLRLTSDQYEWLLTAFYITYIMFEWMALLFRLIPPHIYISLCVLAWGVIASLQAVTNSFVPLLVLRALLGMSEAAFAGIPFYLSFFFRRDELASRTGIFISAAPLATTFASSLAWLITWFGTKFQLWAPWRLLFLVEGFPSVIVAAVVWKCLPDGPESAKFLTRREKQIAQYRLVSGRGELEEKEGQKKLKFNEILQALRDPKCYLTGAMFFSCNVAFSSLPVFLPTIIKEMGWSSVMSQALSAPPYMFSFVVVLLTAYASDRAKCRSKFIILHAITAASGYSLMFLAGVLGLPSWVRYVGVYPAAAGFFSCVTLIITWTLNNQDSDSKKGTGVALLQYFGQMGPLLGTRLYPESDGPLYLKGMAVCACFMTFVGALAWGLRWHLNRENEKRRVEELLADEEDVELLAEGRGSAGRKAEKFMFLL